MEKKRAAFSGSWYPGNARSCLAGIQSYLKDKGGVRTGPFVGGIVPHAGWDYSGSIACRVIASLAGGTAPDLVVIFGHHMRPGSPILLMTHGSFETPLGDIPVDDGFARDFMERIPGKGVVRGLPPATFPEENTIEVQLPFVKHFFPEATVLALGVPPSMAAVREVSAAVTDTAQNRKSNILVMGSTDLTHYGAGFGFTPMGRAGEAHDWVREVNDRAVIRAMLDMDAQGVIREGMSHKNACCSGAAAAAILVSRDLGAVKGIEMDYATSYEKSPGESFVGYAGILFGAVPGL